MLHTILSPAAPYRGVRKPKARPILTMGALFFIFGFVAWMNSVLLPYFRIACELDKFETYLVTFSFYISYLVMAIPASWVLKKTGFKKGMALGLGVMAWGALVFIPAALSRTYSLFLIGLFLQGTGMALLQTASYPYITLLGPVESAARRILIIEIFNKAAGSIAPVVLGAIVLKDIDALTIRLKNMDAIQRMAELNELAARVVMPYGIMIAVLLLLAALVYFSALPDMDTEKEDPAVTSANAQKASIFQFPHLLLGSLAMFLYAGVEVMARDSIISYGASQGMALTEANFLTLLTFLGVLVGYLAGIICIPRYVTQQQALRWSAIMGIAFGLGAVLTQGNSSVGFIALLGMANSLIWPTLWPLCIAGLGRFIRMGSSFLTIGITGGAILPLIYDYLADIVNSQQAYWVLIPCYLYILFYSIKGYKFR